MKPTAGPTETTSSGHSAKKRSKRFRWTFILKIVVFIYLAVGVLIYFMQNRLIFPGMFRQGTRSSRIYPSPWYDLVNLKASDGTRVVGVFGKALDASRNVRPDANEQPTVLFFYGNGSCLADCMDVFDELRQRGENVILVDYEGFGMSGGKVSERGCYAAADAAYDYLLSRSDVNPHQLFVAGWSMGAAVAIDLGARRHVAGVVTVNAFTSMPAMAQHMFPIFPAALMTRPQFDNFSKIQKLTCPILIIHGDHDDLIPPIMSEKLARAARGDVERIIVPGAGHNDIFDVGRAKLYDEIDAFIRECVTQK